MPLSHLEANAAQNAGMKHRSPQVLCSKSERELITMQDDEVADTNISIHFYARAPSTVWSEIEAFEPLKEAFVCILPKFCSISAIEEDEKAELLMLFDFVSAKLTNSDCRIACASIGKPDKFFYTDNNKVLVRSSVFDGTSYSFWPTTLRTPFYISAVVHFRSSIVTNVECKTK